MESIWQENSIGIDVIPSHQALEMIDEQVATVLRELWEHNESITIAGELYIVIYFQSKHIFFRRIRDILSGTNQPIRRY